MNITVAQTKKILTGDFKFKSLPFSMMVTRLKMRYRQDPSQEMINICTEEINNFVKQYVNILQADLAVISSF